MKFWMFIICIVLAFLIGIGLFVAQRSFGLNIFGGLSSSSSSSVSAGGVLG